MPTSNGLVTARDIRQKAVKTLHIVDENVTTDKLIDLAVTDVKNETLIDFDAETVFGSNVTINTTETQHLEVDVTVPSWASLALFVVDASIQITTGGSALTLFYRTPVGDSGEPTGTGFTRTLAANQTDSLHPQESTKTSVTPGSTVSVGLWAWVSSGSNTSNQLALRPGVIFAR